MKKLLYLLLFLPLFVSCESEQAKTLRDAQTSYREQFSNIPDSLIYIKYYKAEADSSNASKQQYVQDQFLMRLEEDSLIVHCPYECKIAYLNLWANEKILDKRTNESEDHFIFKFEYDTKRNYYFLLKSDFPTFVKDQHNYYFKHRPNFKFEPVTSDKELKARNNRYEFVLDETIMVESNISNESSMHIARNEETIFTRWITGDTTVCNYWIDKYNK